jgi:hypothetical protein
MGARRVAGFTAPSYRRVITPEPDSKLNQWLAGAQAAGLDV